MIPVDLEHSNFPYNFVRNPPCHSCVFWSGCDVSETGLAGRWTKRACPCSIWSPLIARSFELPPISPRTSKSQQKTRKRYTDMIVFVGTWRVTVVNSFGQRVHICTYFALTWGGGKTSPWQIHYRLSYTLPTHVVKGINVTRQKHTPTYQPNKMCSHIEVRRLVKYEP